MSYYQCIDCKYYDENDRNSYGEGWCTEYCRYFPQGDKACGRFDRRSDYEGRSNCFLTTTICNMFHFPDKCLGLETLRDFRDSYLVKNEKFYPLLAEYEVVGPIISDKMFNDVHGLEVAEYMYENYLYDIIVNLNTTKNYDEAVDKYVMMVDDLKRMYDVNVTVNNSDVCELSKKIKYGKYKVKRRVNE